MAKIAKTGDRKKMDTTKSRLSEMQQANAYRQAR